MGQPAGRRAESRPGSRRPGPQISPGMASSGLSAATASVSGRSMAPAPWSRPSSRVEATVPVSITAPTAGSTPRPTSSRSRATCAVSPGRARRMREPPGPELPLTRRSAVIGRAREGCFTTVLPSQSAVSSPQACGSQPGTAPARAVEESAAELAMPVGRHRAVPNPAAGARRRPPPRPGRAVGEGLLTDKGHVGGADVDVGASRPRRSQHSRGRAITPADPRTGDTGRRQEARDHAAPRAPIRSGRRRSAVDAGYARL